MAVILQRRGRERDMETINKPLKRRSRIPSSEERVAYLCLIPAFLGLIFLTYLPLAGVLESA